MKHLMLCCVAGLTLLWAGNVGLAQDRAERREQKKMTREDKPGRLKLKAMTPQERRAAVGKARRMVKRDLALLRQMRETAVAEKANGTVAEIDKAIAAKEKQSRRLASLVQKGKAHHKGEAAKGHHAHGKGKGKHGKHGKDGN
jgi:hypothetical protein